MIKILILNNIFSHKLCLFWKMSVPISTPSNINLASHITTHLYNFNYDEKYSNYQSIMDMFSNIFAKFNIDVRVISENSKAFFTQLTSLLYTSIDKKRIVDTDTYLKLCEYCHICTFLQNGTMTTFEGCEDGYNIHSAQSYKRYKGDFCSMPAIKQSVSDATQNLASKLSFF